MPNELNPCAKCGGSPGTLCNTIRTRSFGSTLYTVYCLKCSQSVSKCNKKEADAAWNAANPKEGNPNAV